MKNIKNSILLLVLALSIALSGCAQMTQPSFDLNSIPAYAGEPFVVLEENQPNFTQEDLERGSFETYSPLDALGRCGVAFANIGLETMPTEERGDIGQIKPSGWQTVKYDCVDGKYLYNRCHLIGFQLAGENANEKNLITGTRYLNVTGMLPFENLVDNYVEDTGNHVLYRVTPIYQGTELVARGVQLEGQSIEDDDVRFNVYIYNVQPGVEIDYATGKSWLAEEGRPDPSASAPQSGSSEETLDYVVNRSSGKFHRPDCSGVKSMSKENREDFTGRRQVLIEEGLIPCGQCKP